MNKALKQKLETMLYRELTKHEIETVDKLRRDIGRYKGLLLKRVEEELEPYLMEDEMRQMAEILFYFNPKEH